MTQVFVVNSGSSSIKYQLVDLETEQAVVSGLIERIGEPGEVPDHLAGMRQVLDALGPGREIAAVGHRVVHGGPRFSSATLVTDEVEAQIEELSALAPLHNPANVLGIRAARESLPGVPHVAVFDTAFHSTLPPAAYTYAIDAELAQRHQVRRYGFHGTSHQYVSRRAARFLGRPLESLKTIVLHLGNGASVTAVDGGRSVDTSMGLTPLEGLVMGTRSGDIDAGVVFHLAREAGLSIDELDVLLNRRSGLLGLTGTGDMRDVTDAAARGDAAAVAALEVWRHRIRHYIGAYTAGLGGLDALVFTAGIGENNASLRRLALSGLWFLGVEVDDERNELPSRAERFISPEGTPVAVLVIPTNEELEIARQAAALVA
ncbi:acetate kinase [Salinibacterium sp. SYSU T00001]|uniref:acetate kinase n=1 Tax=Homoserinimonas sedimenticola TaxID=2986805 RepID=UPI002235C8EF|nr:acetate kinase [Salinibacterium sedimenticola]MCW4385184.1 acetate kinase [Salinibacterium sedimenticola]